MTEEVPRESDRRSDVLDAALRTFARFGYRKTSMDDVASEARISRPGLYFLFSSKSGLFRAASDRAIELDLAAAELALADTGRPLADRVTDAFDCWAGRYIGPMGDIPALIEQNPALLGPVAAAGPARFESLMEAALEPATQPASRSAVVRTLISVSVGLKRQTTDRDDYRARIGDAVRLMLTG